ncbi:MULTISPECIES: helix-turn-helix domain-containing protein [unclassified Blastococcus]
MTSEFVVHRPAGPLSGLVAGAVGYRQEGLDPGVHRGLPSPFLTLVLPVDAPLVVMAHADPAQRPGAFDSILGGLHTRPALLAHPGRQEGIQLALAPMGVRALLGVPASALVSVDVGVEDVLGARLTGEMLERVRSARGWAARFAAVEDVLLRAARGTGGPPAEVAEAWRLTTVSGGRLRVAELARRVGWSERHLTARFRAETGLGPKEAARVVRFDRARRTLAARVAAGGPPDLAGLAAAAGYADQSHLTRDWRAFTGLSPLRWLDAEFGFVQDGGVVLAAGSAA